MHAAEVELHCSSLVFLTAPDVLGDTEQSLPHVLTTGKHVREKQTCSATSMTTAGTPAGRRVRGSRHAQDPWSLRPALSPRRSVSGADQSPGGACVPNACGLGGWRVPQHRTLSPGGARPPRGWSPPVSPHEDIVAGTRLRSRPPRPCTPAVPVHTGSTPPLSLETPLSVSLRSSRSRTRSGARRP